MKKTLAIILTLALSVLALASCGKTKPPRIQSESWKLIAVYEGDTEIKLNGELTAEGGEFTFTDTTNGVIYVGTYSERDEFSPTAAEYRISIERDKGRALISVGENAEGETTTTLSMIIKDYTLVFTPAVEE